MSLEECKTKLLTVNRCKCVYRRQTTDRKLNRLKVATMLFFTQSFKINILKPSYTVYRKSHDYDFTEESSFNSLFYNVNGKTGETFVTVEIDTQMYTCTTAT